jgi:hypothetical protein
MSTPNEPAKKGRGRPAGAPPKEHPVIPGDEFIIEAISVDQRGYLRRQRVERSPQQKAVDEQIMVVYKDWLSAGSPAKWGQMPVRGWVISKNFEEEADLLLRKGASLHDLKLVTGKTQIKPLPNLPLPPGKVRIPFCVVARKTEVTGVPASDDSAPSSE